MPLFESFAPFFVGLLAGGVAIFTAAIIVVDVWNYGYAVLTAFLGGCMWAVAAAIGHPVATLLVLALWITVINIVYPGSWEQAAVIGFLAWGTALIVLVMMEIGFGIRFGVFGIPGL